MVTFMLFYSILDYAILDHTIPVLCYAIATIPGHILPITGIRIRARGTYTVHWPVYRISTQVKSSHRVVVFSQHHSRLHNVHR